MVAHSLGCAHRARWRRARGQPAHEAVEAGLALVPEERGIFAELEARANLLLGASCLATPSSGPHGGNRQRPIGSTQPAPGRVQPCSRAQLLIANAAPPAPSPTGSGRPRLPRRRRCWQPRERLPPSGRATTPGFATSMGRPRMTRRRCPSAVERAQDEPRLGGKAGIHEFTESRWITIQSAPRAYPFGAGPV
jgi:hypothetical protein